MDDLCEQPHIKNYIANNAAVTLPSRAPLTLQFKNLLVLSDSGALKCSWKSQEMTQRNIYSFYVFFVAFPVCNRNDFFLETRCISRACWESTRSLYLHRTPHLLSLPGFKWNTNLIWKDHTRPHVVYFGLIIHMLLAAKRGREHFSLSPKSTIPSKQWLSSTKLFQI